ncbi:helix-turn-helix domain-containing protein [Halobellus sp. GM3]|uniref:helix-turn-helix domain-containing protein n=1 Tax=Halobellus sp. GM3 TaxID=3458410 RepID=UPI00403DE1D7
MSGIRAEIAIDSPSDCPAALASAATGGEASAVSKSVPSDPSDDVVEEFTLESPTTPDGTERDGAVSAADTEMREVFAYGSERVYRFERSQARTCLCECVEQFGCPIRDVFSRDGDLTISFHAPDVDTLREVIARLDERWDGVSLHRLVRSGGGSGSGDLVLVDRSELTDRQRDVLRTAHEMGYFEYPKRANAGEVADELGIDRSTFAEHVAAAQGKLLSTILDA